MERTGNSFTSMNMDYSDYVRNSNLMRRAKNIRVIDLNSSTFAVTNVKGTEQSFTLTSGFLPIGITTYDKIIYILSFNPSTNECELGSFGSPDYSTQTVGQPAVNASSYEQYRPFNNLLDSPYLSGNVRPLRHGIWEYSGSSQVKLEIQPEYDSSVNVVILSKGAPPRIVNSGFKKTDDDAEDLIVLKDRNGQANSNTYSIASLDKETKLLLRSQKILKVFYGDIKSGGRLLGGNYQYLFAYQTEDFSQTDIVGESSIFQVFRGTTGQDVQGVDQTSESGKQTVISLTNIDTDFKYLKVYFKHSSGTDVENVIWYELTRPIEITGGNMTLQHTGYEDSIEINFDDLNIDSDVIESATSGTQISGWLLLGGIKGPSYDYNFFKEAAQLIEPSLTYQPLDFSNPLNKQGYIDPANTYNFLGYMDGETYAFGVRFIMLDGSVSPVFPIKGKDYYKGTTTAGEEAAGLIRFPARLTSNYFYQSSDKTIQAMGVEFDLKPLYDTYKAEIVDKTLGFYIVRGERREDRITQGIMVPTLRVPPIAHNFFKRYYYNEHRTDPDAFRYLPCIDGILEAWVFDITDRTQANPDQENKSVVDPDTLDIKDGYMPIYMIEPNDTQPGYNLVPVYDDTAWAFYSTDTILDEPQYVTNLQRRITVVQKAMIESKVTGLLSNPSFQPIYNVDDNFVENRDAVNLGMYYDFNRFKTVYSDANRSDAESEYVPGESFATGSDFISKIAARFNFDVGGSVINNDSYDTEDLHRSYQVSMQYKAFFGLKLDSAPVNAEGALNPIGANQRYFSSSASAANRTHTIGTDFSNYDTETGTSFLVDIYPEGGPTSDMTNLYPNVEGVSYRQCTNRLEWSDVPVTTILGIQKRRVRVFGGDCYVGKMYTRIARSGYEDRSFPIDARNINSGQLYSWIQQSKHNPHLRTVYNGGEDDDRDFYPRLTTDVEEYRSFRIKESGRYSQGYSDTIRTKTGSKIDDTVVVLQSDLFSRVAHSTRHVPNNFKNGYREFVLNNHQDYSVEMGPIVDLRSHRNLLHVIFKHGIGIAEINQRIQTGSDAAGSIFVEPDQVLPPTLGFMSRDIGSQSLSSIVQTPAAIYGVDRDRRKLWRITDGLEVLSDQEVSSFLRGVSLNDAVTGYNPRYNEVDFTADNWTLTFHEGIGKFVSFRSYVPNRYANSGDKYYSIVGSQGYLHDSNNSMEIYGNLEDCYVEFVINEAGALTKVFDYINIVSNEVKPLKVEFFTFNTENEINDEIIPAGTGQYSKVDDEINPLTGDERIYYRDKKFVTQIPNAEIYSSQQDLWASGGRMRNKYLIVRITYNTEEKLQLLSVITTFRYSRS